MPDPMLTCDPVERFITLIEESFACGIVVPIIRPWRGRRLRRDGDSDVFEFRYGSTVAEFSVHRRLVEECGAGQVKRIVEDLARRATLEQAL